MKRLIVITGIVGFLSSTNAISNITLLEDNREFRTIGSGNTSSLTPPTPFGSWNTNAMGSRFSTRDIESQYVENTRELPSLRRYTLNPDLTESDAATIMASIEYYTGTPFNDLTAEQLDEVVVSQITQDLSLVYGLDVLIPDADTFNLGSSLMVDGHAVVTGFSDVGWLQEHNIVSFDFETTNEFSVFVDATVTASGDSYGGGAGFSLSLVNLNTGESVLFEENFSVYETEEYNVTDLLLEAGEYSFSMTTYGFGPGSGRGELDFAAEFTEFSEVPIPAGIFLLGSALTTLLISRKRVKA